MVAIALGAGAAAADARPLSAAQVAAAAASARPTGTTPSARVISVGNRPGAAARPRLDAATDLLALGAYARYLTALSAEEPIADARESQLARGVASGCSGALDDLSGLSGTQLEHSAITHFGEEVDGDLALAAMVPSRAALTRFGTALASLSWSSAASGQITARLISAERAMLGTAPSRICADADTLDAAPLGEPVGTVAFLSRYTRSERRLHAALGTFQTLLDTNATSLASGAIGQINTLVTRFSAHSNAAELSAATATLAALGLPRG